MTAARESLLHFAISKDDVELARFLLQVENELLARQNESNYPGRRLASSVDYWYAVEQGRTAILAEIIKTTGAGLPLDAIVEESGIEVQEAQMASLEI